MRMTNIHLILFVTAVLILPGCRFVDEPIPLDSGFAITQGLPQQSASPPIVPFSAPSAPPIVVATTTAAPQNNSVIANRFTNSQSQTQDVVKNALTWSKRYDELSVKTEKLREKNNAFIMENTDLKYKLSDMQTELDRTKKELKEANIFLQDLQLELTKWKSDVIGFRNEIRTTHTAQLQALGKVLTVLGAEVAEPKPTKTEEKNE